MSRFPSGWEPASCAAAAVARVVCGPTATFGYTLSFPSRQTPVGRCCFIHVADELAPLRHLFVGDDEFVTLEIDHGGRAECVIVERMLNWGIQAGGMREPQPVEISRWDTP